MKIKNKQKKKVLQSNQGEAYNLHLTLTKFGMITDTIARIVKYGFNFGMFFSFMYFSNEISKNIAGKDTNFLMNFIADLNMNEYFSYTIAACGVAYGEVHRRMKKSHIKNRTTRIGELERQKNPDRQSSQLDSYGNTSKEDKRYV